MINKCYTRYCSVCCRRSRPKVFCKKDILRNFAKFRVSFLIKLQDVCNFTWHRCFPVNFAKFLRTTFFTERLRWQLLLLNEIENKKKMETRESKERKFEKKSKRNRVSCFNIYIFVFAFLSSTVEVGR